MKTTETTWSRKALDAQNAYRREWRRKHPDKVRIYNKSYWEKKALQMETQRKEDGNGSSINADDN